MPASSCVPSPFSWRRRRHASPTSGVRLPADAAPPCPISLPPPSPKRTMPFSTARVPAQGTRGSGRDAMGLGLELHRARPRCHAAAGHGPSSAGPGRPTRALGLLTVAQLKLCAFIHLCTRRWGIVAVCGRGAWQAWMQACRAASEGMGFPGLLLLPLPGPASPSTISGTALHLHSRGGAGRRGSHSMRPALQERCRSVAGASNPCMPMYASTQPTLPLCKRGSALTWQTPPSCR